MENTTGDLHPFLQKYLSDTPKSTPTPVRVGPTEATVLVEAITNNRPIRPYHVDKLARDMEAGEWRQTGEPIQISSEGAVLNFNHRGLAVIKSGTTQDFFIVYGLEDESRKFMDIGVGRTATDAYRMAGFRPDPQMCGAVALLALNVESGLLPKVELYRQGGGSNRWSRAEVLKWGEEHRDVLTATVAAYGAGARKPALRGMSPAAWVYALYTLRLLDGPQRVDEFASSIVTRSTSGQKGDPRLALLDYLSERTGILSRKGVPVERIHSMRAGEALYIVYKAYAAWMNNRKITSAQLAPADQTTIPYPTSPESMAA